MTTLTLSPAPANTGDDPETPTRPDLIPALRITPDGTLEVIDIPRHRDGVAAVVGRNPHDVTARVTIAITGGPVTFWAADSAARQGAPLNPIAGDIATGLLPEIVVGGRGFPCRQLANLQNTPLRGVVLVTGYDQDTRVLCGLSDVAVKQLRQRAAGRRAPCPESGSNVLDRDAPTQPLVLAGEVTKVLDQIQAPPPSGRSGKGRSRVKGTRRRGAPAPA